MYFYNVVCSKLGQDLKGSKNEDIDLLGSLCSQHGYLHLGKQVRVYLPSPAKRVSQLHPAWSCLWESKYGQRYRSFLLFLSLWFLALKKGFHWLISVHKPKYNYAKVHSAIQSLALNQRRTRGCFFSRAANENQKSPTHSKLNTFTFLQFFPSTLVFFFFFPAETQSPSSLPSILSVSACSHSIHIKKLKRDSLG